MLPSKGNSCQKTLKISYRFTHESHVKQYAKSPPLWHIHRRLNKLFIFASRTSFVSRQPAWSLTFVGWVCNRSGFQEQQASSHVGSSDSQRWEGWSALLSRMFMRTCVAAYCSKDVVVPSQCVRTLVVVHFSMFFQYWVSLFYTGTDCQLGFMEANEFQDTIEETWCTCGF